MTTTRTIEQRITALEAEVAALRAKSAPAAPVGPVDLARDQYADFTIRKCPPSWTDSGGRDYTGETISKTTPEFCDAIADFLDWQASKDEAKNYSYVNGAGKTVFPAQYARKDAARARAWAVKLRATPPQQWTPPNQRGANAGRLPSAPQDDFNYGDNAGDDGIPF